MNEKLPPEQAREAILAFAANFENKPPREICPAIAWNEAGDKLKVVSAVLDKLAILPLTDTQKSVLLRFLIELQAETIMNAIAMVKAGVDLSQWEEITEADVDDFIKKCGGKRATEFYKR